jgi:hypothetical protein
MRGTPLRHRLGLRLGADHALVRGRAVSSRAGIGLRSRTSSSSGAGTRQGQVDGCGSGGGGMDWRGSAGQPGKGWPSRDSDIVGRRHRRNGRRKRSLSRC